MPEASSAPAPAPAAATAAQADAGDGAQPPSASSVGYLTRTGTAVSTAPPGQRSTRALIVAAILGFVTLANARRLLAETLGTFFLTFTHGALALSVANSGTFRTDIPSRLDVTGQGIGAGFTLLAIVLALGQVSGAHVNPAVSWGFFLKGDMPVLLLLAYWLVQFGTPSLPPASCSHCFRRTRPTGALAPHPQWASPPPARSCLRPF